MSPREPENNCQHRDDAAAYVLGALEHDEVERFTEHLATCAICRAEVAELQPVVDELPASAPTKSAPREMRERILATVRSEAELLGAAGIGADRPAKAARPWYRRNDFVLGVAAAASAGVAALVAVLIAVGGSSHAKIVPGEGIGTARTAKVSLTQRDGHSELVVRRMPQPALGRIYEVWLKRGAGEPKPTNALFSVTNGGSGAVDVPNLHGVKEVLVTSEPAGGSLHPTSAPLIRVALDTA
jgi:anti-sigma-K factor RskA